MFQSQQIRLAFAAVAVGLALSAAPAPAAAAGRTFGLGLSLGNPTGLNGKWNIAGPHALDFTLGWAPYWGEGAVVVNYLYSLHTWRVGGPLDGISLYLGGGLRLGFGESRRWNESGVGLGVRVPVGVSFMFNVPVDVFITLSPGVRVLPPAWFDFDGMIGARWWF